MTPVTGSAPPPPMKRVLGSHFTALPGVACATANAPLSCLLFLPCFHGAHWWTPALRTAGHPAATPRHQGQQRCHGKRSDFPPRLCVLCVDIYCSSQSATLSLDLVRRDAVELDESRLEVLSTNKEPRQSLFEHSKIIIVQQETRPSS